MHSICVAALVLLSLACRTAFATDPDSNWQLLEDNRTDTETNAHRYLIALPTESGRASRNGPKPHVVRKSLSKFLSNSTTQPELWMHNRLQKTPAKAWTRYHLKSHDIDADVFSDVCYEWTAEANGFVFKHWFRTGEDAIFDRRVGYAPGQGGRHAILDQGVASVSSPASEWSHPASEGQDLLVLSLLDNKRNGFFVDLAARYWQRGSNSFHLETYYDWRGICIEPDNIFARGLTINRTCLVICNNPISDKNGDKVHFNYKIGGFNSRGNENGEKVTATLQTVLDAAQAPRVMDYLPLDVEDHEWAVLSKFDFTRYKFLVMTVERPVSTLHSLLTKHGYRWLTQLRGNFGETVYVHQSIPNLAQKMSKYRPTATHYWRGTSHEYLLQPKWNEVTSSCKLF